MRRGWIKVIKQAIWGVGPEVFRSRTRQAKRRASDHRQQQHIIRYHNGQTAAGQAGKAGGNERRTDSERGRQSSYRATESGERERKGNGLHARSPPGAHDHFAERPSSPSKPGGGHWLSAIGYGTAGSQDVASRTLGPLCLRALRSESRSALETHPAVRAKHSEHQQRDSL